MAKYTITHACGHVEDIQIYGKVSGRQYQADREAEKLCGTCYSAKVETERAEKNALCATTNVAAGLPALTGSDKQVAWAESLRAEVLNKITHEAVDKLRERVETSTPGERKVLQFAGLTALDAWIDVARSTTAAKAWIDGFARGGRNWTAIAPLDGSVAQWVAGELLNGRRS